MLARLFTVLATLTCLLLGAVVWHLGAQTPPAPPAPPDSLACQSEVSKAYTQLVADKTMQPNPAALGWSVQLSTIVKEFGYSTTQLTWVRSDLQQWQRNAAQLLVDNNELRRTTAELQQAQQGTPAAPPAPPAN